MRSVCILLFLFIFISLSAQDSIPSSIYIKGEKYEGFIFSKESFVLKTIENQKERYTPSVEDIKVCEEILKGSLGHYMEKNDIHHEGTPIYRILPHYKRQYVGFLNEKGEIIIWINFLRYADFDLSKEVAVVLDGGSSFWSIYVNLKTKELSGMQVNGLT